MSKIDSRPMRVWFAVAPALAACCGLAGCAGSGERLPECRGKSVPINSFVPAASASGRSVSPAVAATVHVSEVDAH